MDVPTFMAMDLDSQATWLQNTATWADINSLRDAFTGVTGPTNGSLAGPDCAEKARPLVAAMNRCYELQAAVEAAAGRAAIASARATWLASK